VELLLHERKSEGKCEVELGCPSLWCHRFPPTVESAAGEDAKEPKNWYKSPSLLERRRRVLVARSFTEKPNGSNSMET
jgi:hypothetical protein